MPKREEELRKNAKPWYLAASIVTIVVILLVGMMRRVDLPTPPWWDVSALPLIHALLNSLAALFIILGGVFIKAGNQRAHRTMMMSAFGVSTIFLLCYVTYHLTSGHTVFGDLNHDGLLDELEEARVLSTRPLYFTILFSHIILAALSFPLILFSIISAVHGQLSLHRRLVKVTYPMWLYVAITGPIVYFLIQPYYP